jgi:hypothetical protein
LLEPISVAARIGTIKNLLLPPLDSGTVNAEGSVCAPLEDAGLVWALGCTMRPEVAASLPDEEPVGEKVALAVPTGHLWKCPKHQVACECLPGDLAAADVLALENVVREQWRSESDREAVGAPTRMSALRTSCGSASSHSQNDAYPLAAVQVLRKLRECGVRSCSALRKCLQTPVWDAKIPRACWFRGAPPLLNQLVKERLGAKLLRSATLEALAKRCRGAPDLAEVAAALRAAFSESEAGAVDSALAALEDAGLWTPGEVRAAMLLPAAGLALATDARARLGALLCRVPGCAHAPASELAPCDRSSCATPLPLCEIDRALCRAWAFESALVPRPPVQPASTGSTPRSPAWPDAGAHQKDV